MKPTFAATLLMTGLALTTLGCQRRRPGHYDDRRVAERRGYDYDHDRDRDRDGAGGRVDVNRASIRELDRLPGLDAEDARRIAENRPYDRASDLVDRRVIGERKYDRIEEFVYAGRTRTERRDDPRTDPRRDDRPYDRNQDRYQDRRFFDDR